MIRDDEVWEKYEQMWGVIKNELGIKFHSEPIYEQKYLKAKVREFDGLIRTNFLGNDMLKENMHYTCIACVTIDSAMRIERKNHPQAYLEECKYQVNKIQTTRLMNAKVESDSESDSETESKSDTELMARLKSSSDSDSKWIITFHLCLSKTL